MEQNELSLRFLGELEISRKGQRLALPQSKKTRALLAYLVISGRAHRRDRLCTLLWDVTDDPRGALRWSLSKLRPLVNDETRQRIVADRESVRFAAEGAYVDVFAVRQLEVEAEQTTVEALQEAAAVFRGELLEGTELPEFDDFQAWLVAEREQLRQTRTKILAALVQRLRDRPEQALPHARALTAADPIDQAARIDLLELLIGLGRREEAEQHYGAARRLFDELGAGGTKALDAAWQRLGRTPGAGQAAAVARRPVPLLAPPMVTMLHTIEQQAAGLGAMVGRQTERARLQAALKEVQAQQQERLVLISGEPGLGKTRLLAELLAEVRRLGGTILDGCAYEAEARRPYGPWIDALRRVARAAEGSALTADLAQLLPEHGAAGGEQARRDRLFAAVVELIAARARAAPPVVVAIDNIQWLDEASAALLHYVVRMSRTRAVLVALAAREGELADNTAMMRTLRSLRRAAPLQEIALGPLGSVEMAQLLRQVAPTADAERVHADSAGNPLFAIELARAGPRQPGLPATLTDLVRERLERLTPEVVDLLGWAAVLGPTFAVQWLAELTSAAMGELVAALTTLERHGVLRALDAEPEAEAEGEAYAFVHNVVREVVYAGISEPRRRLMRQRIAQVLPDGAGDAPQRDGGPHFLADSDDEPS